MTRRNFLGALIASIAIATCPDVVRKRIDFPDVFSCIKVVNFETIAHELVIVQPLDGPTGMIFYMNFNHESKTSQA